jgi:mono/diheme cytochrome c family protein
MRTGVLTAAGVVCLTGAIVWASASAGQGAATSMTVAAENQLVEVYCATCHSKTNKSGDLVLEGFNAGSPLVSAELLERIIRKVRAGQMPPAGAERPDEPDTRAFVEALEFRADAITARLDDPGWRPFQRLNRAEYARVIKDLVGVTIDPSSILPPDTISGGFDNIADVQTISPALMNAYLRGAAAVSRAAVASSRATPARRRLFVCTAGTRACAQTILRRLTDVAYRGAADDQDVADAMAFYDRGRQRAGFDEGIRLALQSVLVSPKFLFRLEPVNSAGDLSDLALASRLSFFLWSSAPDATLIAAAKSGSLHTPAQLSAAALRMLRDRRADSLSTRFAAQWLRLQDLEKKADPALARSMRTETELFVSDVIRRDAGVMELVTSDRSFVDERLAKHYGIPGVRGSAFRRVALPENRRGLLGQSSVLTLTSLVTRTSPVLRGKWVLDVLLGTPPPPPPPNVPALDDSVKAEKNGAPLSTRQRVEEHRRNPSCSSCHRVIDPPGMTLEHFDATGAWRTTDNAVPIDAVADLYDGRRMDGAAGLRAALLARQDMVLRNFTQQLMTYALGRRLSYRDMPAVRAIVRAADGGGNRFSSFIAGVVSSDAFRRSRQKEK